MDNERKSATSLHCRRYVFDEAHGANSRCTSRCAVCCALPYFGGGGRTHEKECISIVAQLPSIAGRWVNGGQQSATWNCMQRITCAMPSSSTTYSVAKVHDHMTRLMTASESVALRFSCSLCCSAWYCDTWTLQLGATLPGA